MNRIKAIVRDVLTRFLRGNRNHGQAVIYHDPVRQEPRARFHARFDPGQHAFREMFTPKHLAEDQVQFGFVNQDGLAKQQTEEWFREGNTQASRLTKTLIRTCSGQIVPAETLRGVCHCGGYDDQITRCQVCNRACCRLCTRRFPDPNSSVTLCPQHHRQAQNAFNTWDAHDRNQENPARLRI